MQALIAEGDPAVEPLLAAFETDTRLTRSVSDGRGMSIYRFVHPVFEAELAAMAGDPRHRTISAPASASNDLAGGRS